MWLALSYRIRGDVKNVDVDTDDQGMTNSLLFPCSFLGRANTEPKLVLVAELKGAGIYEFNPNYVSDERVADQEMFM